MLVKSVFTREECAKIYLAIVKHAPLESKGSHESYDFPLDDLPETLKTVIAKGHLAFSLTLDNYLTKVSVDYYSTGKKFLTQQSLLTMKKIIIVLGADFEIVVEGCSYFLTAGDVMMLDGEFHSIPRVPGLKAGRMSLVTVIDER